MLTLILQQPWEHRSGRQHLETTHAEHGMEGNFVTVTKLSAGRMVYILRWWRIALPLRQHGSVAIHCWRLGGCSIKDQRMLKVLLMRGKLSLWLLGSTKEEVPPTSKMGSFVFAHQKKQCVSKLTVFCVDVGPSLLLMNTDWSTRAGLTPLGNSLTEGKFSFSHHCDVCFYWPPLDKWWQLFQQ